MRQRPVLLFCVFFLTAIVAISSSQPANGARITLRTGANIDGEIQGRIAFGSRLGKAVAVAVGARILKMDAEAIRIMDGTVVTTLFLPLWGSPPRVYKGTTNEQMLSLALPAADKAQPGNVPIQVKGQMGLRGNLGNGNGFGTIPIGKEGGVINFQKESVDWMWVDFVLLGEVVRKGDSLKLSDVVRVKQQGTDRIVPVPVNGECPKFRV